MAESANIAPTSYHRGALVQMDSQFRNRLWQDRLRKECQLPLWFAALRKGDCLRISKYLRDDPSLLKQFLRVDDEEKVGDGMTALHVAVKKGWPKLVKDILEVFVNGHSFQKVPSHSESSKSQDSASEPTILKDSLMNELLTARAFDGFCSLNALAMAVLNGNVVIVCMLIKASYDCMYNPYSNFIRVEHEQFEKIVQTVLSPDAPNGEVPVQKSTSVRLSELRTLMSNVKDSMPSELQQSLMTSFEEDVNFNFLPWEEYLFHHACTSSTQAKLAFRFNVIREAKLLTRSVGYDLVKYLFKLQDGQGRPPLHVAVEEADEAEEVVSSLVWFPEQAEKPNPEKGGEPNTESEDWNTVKHILKLIDGEEYEDCVNARDSAGRTPLHRGIGTCRDDDAIGSLIVDKRTDRNAVIKTNFLLERLLYVDTLSTNHEFARRKCLLHTTPVHMAVIRAKDSSLSALRLTDGDPPVDSNAKCYMSIEHVEEEMEPRRCYRELIENFLWTPIQMAAILGHVSTLSILIRDDLAYDPGRVHNLTRRPKWKEYKEYPALQLAAASRRLDGMERLLNRPDFDKFVVDHTNSTVLNYAAGPSMVFPKIHLLDLVSCNRREDFPFMRMRGRGGGAKQADPTEREHQREGSINFLLQTGIGMWEKNKWREDANPGPIADHKSRSWWYERLTEETLELRKSLSSAGNAISVTAALVATASFVGPLQPPRGYDDNCIQTNNVGVKIFLFCNTSAFYLALAAIMLSMIPSLPMTHEVKFFKLQQRAVRTAVAFLMASIGCIVVAFAASTVAVLPKFRWSNYGGVALGIAITGGFILLVTTFQWCRILLRLNINAKHKIERSCTSFCKKLDIFQIGPFSTSMRPWWDW